MAAAVLSGGALAGGAALAATSQGQHSVAARPQAQPVTRPAAADAATRTAAGHRATARTKTKIITCLNKGRVRPTSYILACGDGSDYLARLHWESWTSGLATATGKFILNTCTPSCAQGKFLTNQVIVVLWRPAAVPHWHGQRQFTEMTIIYTGKRPAHTAQSFTQSLWYPFVR
jgi:hypothetical protein